MIRHNYLKCYTYLHLLYLSKKYIPYPMRPKPFESQILQLKNILKEFKIYLKCLNK